MHLTRVVSLVWGTYIIKKTVLTTCWVFWENSDSQVLWFHCFVDIDGLNYGSGSVPGPYWFYYHIGIKLLSSDRAANHLPVKKKRKFIQVYDSHNSWRRTFSHKLMK